jgi:hypothetical protein
MKLYPQNKKTPHGLPKNLISAFGQQITYSVPCDKQWSLYRCHESTHVTVRASSSHLTYQLVRYQSGNIGHVPKPQSHACGTGDLFPRSAGWTSGRRSRSKGEREKARRESRDRGRKRCAPVPPSQSFRCPPYFFISTSICAFMHDASPDAAASYPCIINLKSREALQYYSVMLAFPVIRRSCDIIMFLLG